MDMNFLMLVMYVAMGMMWSMISVWHGASDQDPNVRVAYFVNTIFWPFFVVKGFFTMFVMGSSE